MNNNMQNTKWMKYPNSTMAMVPIHGSYCRLYSRCGRSLLFECSHRLCHDDHCFCLTEYIMLATCCLPTSKTWKMLECKVIRKEGLLLCPLSQLSHATRTIQLYFGSNVYRSNWSSIDECIHCVISSGTLTVKRKPITSCNLSSSGLLPVLANTTQYLLLFSHVLLLCSYAVRSTCQLSPCGSHDSCTKLLRQRAQLTE